MDMIYIISIWLLPVLIAVTFHEAAHGFVARFLGDETASRLGRVSLNPLRHIDPFGTILLPGLLLLARSPFLFGYAKPVTVNFRALRNPRIGMVLVAAAYCIAYSVARGYGDGSKTRRHDQIAQRISDPIAIPLNSESAGRDNAANCFRVRLHPGQPQPHLFLFKKRFAAVECGGRT